MAMDKVLVCKECGAEFIFTASEQEFYAEKGFTNEPGRCPVCRSARKTRGSNSNNNSSKQLYTVICSECGCETQVPFQPKDDRPVYCRNCFASKRR